MGRLKDAQQFAELARSITTFDDLAALVDAVARDIGFRRFGFGHHYDHNIGIQNAFFLHNYPDNWAEPFIARNYYLNDPTVRACKTSFGPFHWDKIPKMLSLSDAEKELMEAATREDVADGFTIPIAAPNGFGASFNFVSPKRQKITDSDLLLANVIGRIAFDAADRIQRLDSAQGPREQVRLSKRQRECLVLAAQGKTDWEIARILGISEDTAIMHLKDARERYGMNKRISLVVRALSEGTIDFTEILQ